MWGRSKSTPPGGGARRSSPAAHRRLAEASHGGGSPAGPRGESARAGPPPPQAAAARRPASATAANGGRGADLGGSAGTSGDGGYADVHCGGSFGAPAAPAELGPGTEQSGVLGALPKREPRPPGAAAGHRSARSAPGSAPRSLRISSSFQPMLRRRSARASMSMDWPDTPRVSDRTSGGDGRGDGTWTPLAEWARTSACRLGKAQLRPMTSAGLSCGCSRDNFDLLMASAVSFSTARARAMRSAWPRQTQAPAEGARRPTFGAWVPTLGGSDAASEGVLITDASSSVARERPAAPARDARRLSGEGALASPRNCSPKLPFWTVTQRLSVESAPAPPPGTAALLGSQSWPCARPSSS